MTVERIKTAVRERDCQRCTKCGMTADAHFLQYQSTLQVHRLDPGSPYTVDGSVTLCIPCHAKEPKRRGLSRLRRWLFHRQQWAEIGLDIAMPPVPPHCKITDKPPTNGGGHKKP